FICRFLGRFFHRLFVHRLSLNARLTSRASAGYSFSKRPCHNSLLKRPERLPQADENGIDTAKQGAKGRREGNDDDRQVPNRLAVRPGYFLDLALRLTYELFQTSKART